MPDLLVTRTAIISSDGLYRYGLSRVWDKTEYSLPFVMLNPSIADANIDDPTIRRCMRFARREGYGGIEIVNLYAFRATSPVDLWKALDPCGPENEQHLAWVAEAAEAYGVPIVCAWGTDGGRNNRQISILQQKGAELMCLGKTKDGHPRHPLYVRADQKFEPLFS